MALSFAAACTPAGHTESTTAPAPPPSSASVAAPPASSATRPAPSAASATHAPAAAAEKVFTHSKLALAFSYPAFLTAAEDAKGVLLSSAVLATSVDLASDTDKTIDLSLSIRVTVERGDVVAAARRRVPAFAEAFVKGTEASFKESPDYAERVAVGTSHGYRFTMGSHGTNEEDTFVAAGKSTILARCSFVGESLHPKVSEQEQLDACHRVVATLKL